MTGAGYRISTPSITLAGLRFDPYVDKHDANTTAGLQRVVVTYMNLKHHVLTLGVKEYQRF